MKSNQQITGLYDYMPFGEQKTLEQGNDRLSFIGKENDVESVLGYYGVRMYDNGSGRFLSIKLLTLNSYAVQEQFVSLLRRS